MNFPFHHLRPLGLCGNREWTPRRSSVAPSINVGELKSELGHIRKGVDEATEAILSLGWRVVQLPEQSCRSAGVSATGFIPFTVRGAVPPVA